MLSCLPTFNLHSTRLHHSSINTQNTTTDHMQNKLSNQTLLCISELRAQINFWHLVVHTSEILCIILWCVGHCWSLPVLLALAAGGGGKPAAGGWKARSHSQGQTAAAAAAAAAAGRPRVALAAPTSPDHAAPGNAISSLASARAKKQLVDCYPSLHSHRKRMGNLDPNMR